MVTRDFMAPVLHRVYPVNIPGVSLVPQLAGDLIARYKHLVGDCDEATLVFDKDNVSDDAMERLCVSDVRFVAAVSWRRYRELLSQDFACDQQRGLDAQAGDRSLSRVTKVEEAFKNMFSRRSTAGYYGEVCRNIAFPRW